MKKKAEIKLNTCERCPHLKWCGEMNENARCKHPAIPDISDILMTYPFNDVIDWGAIPDWCPLPDAD